MIASRIVVLIFAVAVIASHAAESNLTLTVDGITYSNVTFGTVSPSSVSIYHSTGIAKVPLTKLPSELQQQFGYDPQKATAWQKSERQAAEAQLATHEEAKRRTEWIKNNVVNIGGVVVDVVEGKGVILSNKNDAEALNRAYIQYGAIVSPESLKIHTCFLECDTKKFVNGSTVYCSAYMEGTYSYITVMGANMKISRWVYYGQTDPSKRHVNFF